MAGLLLEKPRSLFISFVLKKNTALHQTLRIFPVFYLVPRLQDRRLYCFFAIGRNVHTVVCLFQGKPLTNTSV